MPELPEVETWRRRLEERGLCRAVSEVELRDADKLRAAPAPEVARSWLRGRQFMEARRHGKHLFAGLDAGGWLRLHFGMSGGLEFLEGDDPWPDHSCLRVVFEDGGRMAYVNVRKLGQIDRVDSVEGFVEEKGMGPDPVADGMGPEGIGRALEGRRGMVKSALMNQDVLAGLGNEMGDEILFEAGIHPRRAVDDLGEGDLADLSRSVMDVLDAALAACRGAAGEPAGDVRWPDDFLLQDREPGATCPRCGGTIERVRVSGRSAYFCPGHQG